MRCPTCGTDNAPDSRFCGECGARLSPGEQRLAPTQKISEDATFPRQEIAAAAAGRNASSAPRSGNVAPPVRPSTPQIAPHPALISTPPGYAPVSQHVAPSKPPSKPPNGSAKSLPPAQVAPSPAPPAPTPSLSLPIPARRPWGLIIVLLVIDLGLAAAGAYLLSEGLSSNGDRPSAPSSGSAKSGAREAPPAPIATAAAAPIDPYAGTESP